MHELTHEIGREPKRGRAVASPRLSAALAALFMGVAATAVVGCGGSSSTAVADQDEVQDAILAADPTAENPADEPILELTIDPGSANLIEDSAGQPPRATAAGERPAEISGDGSDGPTAVLQSMTSSTTAIGTRVTLSFDGRHPDFIARYVDELREDPTDATLALAGSATMQIILMGATGDDGFQGGERRYSGPSQVVVSNSPVVQELVLAGDFEAVLTVGIGLNAEVPFSISRGENPSTILIDFSHP